MADGATLPARESRYAPIGDYALIGDTQAAALVGRKGAIDWLCLPDMPDASIFAELLDCERGGCFFAGPAERAHSTRRYLPDTPILESTHETDAGTLRITDFMPIPSGGRRRDVTAARRVIRLVEALDGEPELAIRFAPRPNFGEVMPHLKRRSANLWTLSDANDFLALQSDIPLERTAQGTLGARIRLKAGEQRLLALSFCRADIGVLMPLAGCLPELGTTERWWQDFCATCSYDGPFRDAVVRSLITLRLLTFSQSGAVLAAPTTSLPEAVGGTRNWDYRFCWLRDSSFILGSFLDLGYRDEGAAFFRWLIHATRLTAPQLDVFYNVFGHTMVPERIRHALEGWRGSGPVRTGNSAHKQLQLDVYGEIINSALLYARQGGTLDFAQRGRLRELAGEVCKSWTLPDNGMWEVRNIRRHHTYSKAMCWAGLDSLLQLCQMGHLSLDTDRLRRERAAIRENILSHGVSAEHGTLTGAYGHDYMDAALLLLPRLGLIAADDPLMVATFERIERDLGHGAQIRRYPSRIDGFATTEGTFTACGFWAADYLARRGDTDAAHDRIAALLGNANDLGLMSEETDPETGEMLGNFPQAFSHADLIRAATTLGRQLEGRKPKEKS
ncbi:glycoside hydrolase family 15 protein [Pseudosulfitobacter koreensis]|uniref:Glycoside hydrolase family 15 protein n=1 Tax=Pseudosulfitobacter koreensis TaxID=2968472 RepID=A0ABT1YZQ8_9RHOB|nr:glycoside hydrolase family 15 protein [Pseudosulfitobacter koreense]MCR8826360.1 glycoside hydrolase family 15 protein [Pseudosulfitobacter koreense]